MRSTMQDGPLLDQRHRAPRLVAIRPTSEIITCEADGYRRATFAEVAERAERLARALRHLGVGEGDRVGTFSWNHQEHMEAYLAVPSMGAVLHTLNVRLFPEQLALRDQPRRGQGHHRRRLAHPAARQGARRSSRPSRRIIVRGEGDRDAPRRRHPRLRVAARRGGARLRVARPRRAGRRGHVLHVAARRATRRASSTRTARRSCTRWRAPRPTALGYLRARTACCSSSRMFHANGWGAPYTAFLAGGELVMPQHLLQGVPLAARSSPTRVRPSRSACRRSGTTCCTPRRTNAADLSSLRVLLARRLGRAALADRGPSSERFGRAPSSRAWGMTETSPLGAVAIPPSGRPRTTTVLAYRVKAGRVVVGVEMRICDDEGNELATRRRGRRRVRGARPVGHRRRTTPRTTPRSSTTAGCAPATWARSTELGFLTISDRTKDVIKSGGEWISSVELENAGDGAPRGLRGRGRRHPRRAAGTERPLVCVVATPGSDAARAEELVGLPPAARRQVVAAGAVGVHRGGPEDLRRQVRQEGAARAVRQGRARRRDPRPSRRVSVDEGLAELAAEIDALAERLADRSLELLRTAVREGPTTEAARREKLVTRARRSLEKAATLLRGLDDER